MGCLLQLAAMAAFLAVVHFGRNTNWLPLVLIGFIVGFLISTLASRKR